jgi:hypothetical protein
MVSTADRSPAQIDLLALHDNALEIDRGAVRDFGQQLVRGEIDDDELLIMAHGDEQPAVVDGDGERIDPGEGGDLVLRAEGEALEQRQLLRIDDENASVTLECAELPGRSAVTKLTRNHSPSSHVFLP